MKIQYEDEYGVSIYTHESNMVPSIGESVFFQDEDYRVRNVTWAIEHNTVVVEVTQNMTKTSIKEDNGSTRLNQLNNAIIAVNKRQDASEKKGRALTEQVVGIRKHINQRIQQEKKDNDTR